MKLGELFVDLNVNSGGAFNALSGFAFRMNNIAELAKKTTSIMKDMFGDSFERAHGILNTAEALSLTVKQVQGLKTAFGNLGVSWDKTRNKLQKLDEEFVSSMLMGHKDGRFLEKMSRFGLTPDDVRNAKSSLEIMQKMLANADRIGNKRFKNAFLRMYGFDVNDIRALKEYFNNPSKYNNDERNASKKQLENLRKTRDEIHKLSTNWEILQQTMAVEFGDGVLDFLQKLNGFLERTDIITKELREDWHEFTTVFRFMAHPIDTLKDLHGKADKASGGLLSKYDNLSWWQKLVAAPVTSMIPGGQAYLTGSLIGEGATTGYLNLMEWLNKNEEEGLKTSKGIETYAQKIYDNLADKKLTFEKDDLDNYKGMTTGDIVDNFSRQNLDPAGQFQPQSGLYIYPEDDQDVYGEEIHSMNDNRIYNNYIYGSPDEAIRILNKTGMTKQAEAMSFVG